MKILIIGTAISVLAILLAYYHLVWHVIGVVAAVVLVIDGLALIVLAIDNRRK